jgi:hypothetical protein
MRLTERRRGRDLKLARLGSVAVLGRGRQPDLRWLETVADEVEVGSGCAIVSAGEPLRAVVLPANPHAPATWGSAAGPTEVGYVIGGVAISSRRPQPTTVTAAEPMRVWLVPVAQFELLRKRFSAIELAFIDEARRLMG